MKRTRNSLFAMFFAVLGGSTALAALPSSVQPFFADDIPAMSDSLALTDSLTVSDLLALDSLALDSLGLDSLTLDSLRLVREAAELREAVCRVLAADSAVNVKYNTLMDDLFSRFHAEAESDGDSSDNPLFIRLLPPLTLYRSPVQSVLKTTDEQDAKAADVPASQLPWDKDLELMDALDKVLLATYLENPMSVSRTEEQLMGTKGVNKEVIDKTTDRTKMKVAVDGKVENITAAPTSQEMVVTRPNFWTTKGNMSNQWSESYLSENWYQGGISNLNILSLITFDANYNDKQKVTWNNRLEAKVGFYMNDYFKSAEEGRSQIQSNTDLLRLTSTLNLKAIKNWNYAVQLQGYTQMMNQFKTNGEEQELKSCFLSPTYASFSVGMNYSKAFKNGKGNLSTFVGPVTYNCRYVNNDYVMNHSGYIPQEMHKGETEKMFHHYYDDFGSKVEVNLSYNLAKNLSYSGRFFYYTTLHYVQTEWESTFSLKANKYLSTKLYIHPRFDDSRPKNEKWGYAMFKELLSIGFDYTW